MTQSSGIPGTAAARRGWSNKMADGPFKEAVTKLGEALVDFSELEVVTFTGDVTAILKSDKKSID